MKNNKYSDLKIIQFPEKLASFRAGRIAAPLYVRVKPVNFCNHGCHWCVYKADRREATADNSPAPIENTMHTDMVEKDALPAEKLLEILDDFKSMGVNAVTYSGGGEPLLHKEIVAAMCKTLACGIDLSIITNGQSLNGPRAEVLGRGSWVRVSMDYTTAEEMARFRRVPERMFQQVMDNITMFARLKQPTCDLGVNFIVHRDNCHGQSLVGFALMMKASGVSNVRFSPMWCQDFAAYHEPLRVPVAAQLRRIQEIVDDTFTVNSTYNIDSASHGHARGQSRCLFAQTVPVVGADQNVYACHNKAYDRTGMIGSIKDQNFSEMWFSKQTEEFFRRLNPNEHCQHQCANHNKVALYNELTEASYDNFV